MGICPRCLREFGIKPYLCPFDGVRLSRRTMRELVAGKPSSESLGLFGERYAVRGLLGRGAMTRVLLGEDVFSKEPVAIKLLDKQHAHHAHIVERFLRESEAVGRIVHPCVVRSLGSGKDIDGLPYLVLEHLQGEPLASLLRRDPVPHTKLSLRILTQMASALEAAHEAGTVHRDVKPANIVLLGDEGAPLAAKLVDFGFARLNHIPSRLTPPGTALGTVEYMAPEQVLGDRIDPRTDIYALGVLAYRLFTGVLPFSGQGLDLMAKQLTEAPAPPSRRMPDLPPRIERVILAALRKNPALRYPSARAMHDDLDRLAGAEPLLADTLPGAPDTFEPSPGLAREGARFLYARVGLAAPTW